MPIIQGSPARLDVRGEMPRPKKKTEPPATPECPLTDIDARHATYEALLGQLSLASDHQENLLSRGLSLEMIQELGYKTTPVMGMTAIAKHLQEAGYYLSGVPGFYRKDGKWSFVSEGRGILIPVRDMKGRIQGLQIRRDNVTRRKFRWVSSTNKPDGCGAEVWVHITGQPRSTVLLTEGPLKADVVHALTGQTVVAVAGVNSLSKLEPVLQVLKGVGTKKIMTAFDMDFLTNPHVQNGYTNLTQLLAETGFQYGTYLWDPHYKGLDDYVWEYCMQGRSSQ